MKMFRVVLVSKKMYRNGHRIFYRAMVLANNADEALAKVEASIGKPLTEYGDGRVEIYEVDTDVYTY